MSEKISIKVGAFASLKPYLPGAGIGETKTLYIEEHTGIKEIMHLLKLPEDEVQIIMRNHELASPEDIVEAGDRIVFLPLIDGG